MLTRHHDTAVTAVTPIDADVWAEPEPEPEAEPAAELIPLSGPVFVDSSGRRARKVRRIGWIVGAACGVYTVGLVLSLTGATPIAPRTLLPLPGVPSSAPGDGEAEAGTVELPAEPSPATTAGAGFGRTPGYAKANTAGRTAPAKPRATTSARATASASPRATGTAGGAAATPSAGAGGGSGSASASASGNPVASASAPVTGSPAVSDAASAEAEPPRSGGQ
jgi:hypothetical protein